MTYIYSTCYSLSRLAGLTPCTSGPQHNALIVCGSWRMISLAAQPWTGNTSSVWGPEGGHMMIIIGLRGSDASVAHLGD